MKKIIIIVISFLVISTMAFAGEVGKSVPALTTVTGGFVELKYNRTYIVEHSGCNAWYIISVKKNSQRISEKFGCYKPSREWKCPYSGRWEVQFTNHEDDEKYMYLRFTEK